MVPFLLAACHPDHDPPRASIEVIPQRMVPFTGSTFI
jgi:hypothetical protein